MLFFISKKKLRSLVRQEAELVIKESQRLAIITRPGITPVTFVGIPVGQNDYYNHAYSQKETDIKDILTRILYVLKELGFDVVVNPEKSSSWEIKKK